MLTLDQLQRRGKNLANRCFMCQANEESIDHILLRCVKTRVLWGLLFAFFGVVWVFPASTRQALEGWKGSFVGKKRKSVWKAALFYWIIWKTRNRIVF